MLTIGGYSTGTPTVVRMCLMAFLLCHTIKPAHADPTVRLSCPATDDVCEFRLVLAHNTTMMIVPHGASGKSYPVRISKEGVFYKRALHDCRINQRIPGEEQEQVLTADGFYKNVMIFNGSLPGPPIVVYEGQQVVVHLRNALLSEATTLHFHGILQHNTPWMDGAGSISQCPINAGETFTYRFIANPVGTHWYHSHYGTQRTMGAYGPLIILPRDDQRQQEIRGRDRLPKFAAEYILQVSDWMNQDSFQIYNLVNMEAISYIDGYDIPDAQCFNSTKQSDGFDCGVVPFSAGLINGKGRRYDPVNDTPLKQAPLEVFNVKKGFRYRFRMICASMTFGFRVSVDRHPLHVIATDGKDVKSKRVHSIIIFSGERYDFWIDASDPDNHGSYWIRAETLERYQNGKPIRLHHVEAILQYDESSHDEPRSKRTRCTSGDRCDVINCPFRAFGPEEHQNCVPLTDLKLTTWDTTYSSETEDDFQEYFLNFHFAEENKWRSTINGIQHVQPVAPPQVYPEDVHQYLTPCDLEKCRKTICQCTHKLDIPLGKVVQLVMATTVVERTDALNGLSHQVHLHGHDFQVIKTAFPIYNNVTGFYKAMNSDLKCDEESEFCNILQWKDPQWQSGNVPGIIKRGAPVKDTVVVPVGGYVVVRLRTTNPGFWYMHCHTEFHNEEGMAMFLQVGNISEMNAAPDHMTTCGNSPFTSEQFLSRLNSPINPVALKDARTQLLIVLQWTVFGLGTLSALLLATNTFLLCRQRAHLGYTQIPNGCDTS